MNPILVRVGIAAVAWALVQGFVPLAIESFTGAPNGDPGEQITIISHRKKVFTKVSIGILAAIFIGTIISYIS